MPEALQALAVSSSGRGPPPVRLADQHRPSRAKAAAEKLGSSGDAVADPRGADTGGQIDGLGRDMAGGVTVDELDLFPDAELGGAGPGLVGEGRADVDTGSRDPVVTSPGAQHLARAAGQVEHLFPGSELERFTQVRELGRGQWVVDPVAALADGDDAGEVHAEVLSLRPRRGGDITARGRRRDVSHLRTAVVNRGARCCRHRSRLHRGLWRAGRRRRRPHPRRPRPTHGALT